MLVSCCPRLVNNSNVLHLFFISFVTLCVHIVHLNEWYFLSQRGGGGGGGIGSERRGGDREREEAEGREIERLTVTELNVALK